jgi:hypothetical protein
MISATAISVLDYGVDMSAINLTQEIINQFSAHGEEDYPYECCGFILGNFKGDESFSLEYLPAANTKEENRERRFLIDPMAYQKSEDEADAKDLSVIRVGMYNADNGQIFGISFIFGLLVCHGVNEETPFAVLFLGVGCREVFKTKRFIPFEIA